MDIFFNPTGRILSNVSQAVGGPVYARPLGIRKSRIFSAQYHWI